MRIALETLFAIIGTVSFCVLFCIPVRYYLLCGAIGGTGWLIYSILGKLGLSEFFSCLIATMAIVLLSRISAVRTKTPSTVYMIPGILPLIPGGGIYWTVFYLVNNQTEAALVNGFSAVKTVVAIVLAIVIIFEIPQKVFNVRKKS